MLEHPFQQLQRPLPATRQQVGELRGCRLHLRGGDYGRRGFGLRTRRYRRLRGRRLRRARASRLRAGARPLAR